MQNNTIYHPKNAAFSAENRIDATAETTYLVTNPEASVLRFLITNSTNVPTIPVKHAHVIPGVSTKEITLQSGQSLHLGGEPNVVLVSH